MFTFILYHYCSQSDQQIEKLRTWCESEVFNSIDTLPMIRIVGKVSILIDCLEI